MDMSLTDSRAFDAADPDAALRPLGWSELCARLVAARDFRRDRDNGAGQHAARSESGLRPQSGAAVGTVLAAGTAPGSFHRGTARMLADIDKGKRDVNPTSSTYGKDNQGTPVDSRNTSLTAPAGRQADENRHD
jgi:hypothetical protein